MASEMGRRIARVIASLYMLAAPCLDIYPILAHSAASIRVKPNNVFIAGVPSRRQLLPLSCESRSATDWAAFFGSTIDELTFFSQLPKTDNPDTGFVGDVNDHWGNLPPRGYGVHTEPVAALLRTYGLPAEARRNMTVDALESEVTAGRPVIVWTTGFRHSNPVVIIDSSGTSFIAARFEHTQIVVGHNRDTFTVVDPGPGQTFQVGRALFAESWSVLGNQAIVASVSPAQSPLSTDTTIAGDAQITWPQSGTLLRDSVDIMGTAYSDNFSYYKFEFVDPRCGPTGLCFVAGNYSSPVYGGRLMRWNTASAWNGARIPNGTYTLRLTVVGKDGSFLQQIPEVVITLDNP